jgi:hypothetical protein
MSFRQYGGINYAARNNIVKNNFTNASNLSIMNKVGQPDSKINVESTLDVYAINLTSPTYTLNENGVVPKSYVDLVSVGLTPLQACQCATTGPLSPAGDPSSTVYSTPLVIDGYTVQNNDRVLIKDQPPNSTPYLGSVENGIYNFNTGAGTFARSSDYLSGTDAYGAYTLVQNGTVNANKQFIELSQGTVGTAALLFTTFSSSFVVGQGLEKISTGSSTTIQVKSNLSSPSFITSLAVSGATSLGSLTVSGATSLGSLTVSGATSLGSLTVSGATSLGSLTVSGSTSLGSLTVSGATSLGSLTVNSGPIQITATDMTFNTTNFPTCTSSLALLSPSNNSNSVPTCAWVQSAISSNLGSYATTSYVNSTFQPLAGMSSYLTTSTASATYAPLISPNLTGVPTAPTAAALTNNTQIATTAYVDSAVAGGGGSSYWSLDSSNNLFPTAYSTNNLCIGTNTNTNNLKMLVVGNTFLNGDTNIGGAFTVNNFLTTLNNGLTVNIGTTTLNSGLTVNGSGITTLNTPLSVTGNVLLNGSTTTLYSNTTTSSLIIQGPPVTSNHGVEIWVNGGGSGSCFSVTPTSATDAVITLTKTTNISGNLNATGTNNTINGYAPLNSPGLTGVPTAPTAIAGTSTTQIATTQFVVNSISTVLWTQQFTVVKNGLYQFQVTELTNLNAAGLLPSVQVLFRYPDQSGVGTLRWYDISGQQCNDGFYQSFVISYDFSVAPPRINIKTGVNFVALVADILISYSNIAYNNGTYNIVLRR